MSKIKTLGFNLLKGVFFGLGTVGVLYVYAAWQYTDPTSVTDTDTLTAARRNAVVESLFWKRSATQDISFEGGNVGIGTNSSDAKLKIVIPTSATDAENVVEVWDHTGPDVSPFVIKGDGRVGIATDTPSANLHVAGDVQIDGTVRGATYGFGGTFITKGQSQVCHTVNNTTSDCTCPTGYSKVWIGGFDNGFGGYTNCDTSGCYVYICYK